MLEQTKLKVLYEKTGFIYIWFDTKRKMYYIGCHVGKEDDGYICSSKWKKRNRRMIVTFFKIYWSLL